MMILLGGDGTDRYSAARAADLVRDAAGVFDAYGTEAAYVIGGLAGRAFAQCSRATSAIVSYRSSSSARLPRCTVTAGSLRLPNDWRAVRGNRGRGLVGHCVADRVSGRLLTHARGRTASIR